MSCKGCGEPFDKHLGLQGTCMRLQEAIGVVETLERENKKLTEENIGAVFVHNDLRGKIDRYRTALEFIVTQVPKGETAQFYYHMANGMSLYAREALKEEA